METRTAVSEAPNPDMPIELPKPSPFLIIVSGPSGVGKDVTLKRMQARGLPFHFLVTLTTRPPRAGEVEGVDYHFVSVEQFDERVGRGEFLENAMVYDHQYGNLRADIQAALARGEDVIMRIDPQGAETIRHRVEGAIFIFMVSTLSELESRLRARKTESEDVLQKRLRKAAKELQEMSKFEYMVQNRDRHLDETVDDIQAIIRAEKLKTHPREVRFLPVG